MEIQLWSTNQSKWSTNWREKNESLLDLDLNNSLTETGRNEHLVWFGTSKRLCSVFASTYKTVEEPNVNSYGFFQGFLVHLGFWFPSPLWQKLSSRKYGKTSVSGMKTYPRSFWINKIPGYPQSKIFPRSISNALITVLELGTAWTCTFSRTRPIEGLVRSDIFGLRTTRE